MSGITYTHDRRPVYPAGAELPDGAHGWTQCDNNGGGYSTWLAPEDCAQAAIDYKAVEAQAAKLRTRVQCEAALREIYVEPCGTCASMRLTYQITVYADMWPLRQVVKS